MTGYLLIVAHEEPDELHYPTEEEVGEAFKDRREVSAPPPKLLGLFDTRESAESFVMAAQAAGDPTFFGKGCFATVPVDCFGTTSEIITEGF